MFSNEVLQMIRNPYNFTIKKYIFELLQSKYPEHEEVIDRLCAALTTKSDAEKFGKLISDLFETGFMKAIEEHKTQLAKAGVTFTIGEIKKTPKSEKIFPDQNDG